jgi:hypothetical protein
MPDLNEDAVVACADLVGRAGAAGFEIGWTGDDDHPRWYAHAQYAGTRLMVQDRHTPTDAAMGLAERLLRGARCRCRRLVALGGGPSGDHCRWRLAGPKWEPGCEAPPVKVDGRRGDIQAMRRAMGER